MLATLLLGTLSTLLSQSSAEQFTIPEVERGTQYALSKNPNYHAYTGKVVPTNHSAPHASPEASSSFWMGAIAHQGVAPYAENGYTVFRNVMDYGATGNGVDDDTSALNSAIDAGNRCGEGCASTTTTPAVVYLPGGTYLISSPVVDYYLTQIIGDPTDMPTIKVSADFQGSWVFDTDPYYTSNLNWGSTNVFYRQIRNIIFDTTAVEASKQISAIHWPTAQATSVENCQFNMNSASGTQHQGIFCESGSAGYLGDLTFNGGNIGLAIGNQQFTIRNAVFNNVVTAISHYWDWSFLYRGLQINNCQTGIDITSGGSSSQSVGSIILMDSSISNTPIGIKTAYSSSSSPATAGTVVLENVSTDNVPVIVQDSGNTALAGSSGSQTVGGWAQGHTYTSSSSNQNKVQGSISTPSRPAALLSGSDYYAQSKPQYTSTPASSFRSVRSGGATGNGQTDDTTALQNVINSAAQNGQVVYIDAGIYKITKTLMIPPGSQIVGEAYPVIMSSGSFWDNMNSPQPVVQVGNSGQSGKVWWSDTIVSTQGAQPGATLIQWNLASSSGAYSGLWDVHTRVGGFEGSNLQVANCPTTPSSASVNTNCIAAFMHFQATSGSAGLYMENNWFWTADHDIDNSNNTQITIYSGRGMLIESSNGPFWLSGTAVEHSSLYQYQFANTKNIFAGHIQTETPYYQPEPNALTPFSPVSSLNDPNFSSSCSGQNGNCAAAWGLRILNSQNILIYGAGLYSFFNDYSTSCSDQNGSENCQQNIFSMSTSSSNINVYSLNTIGTVNMVVLNDDQSIAQYGANVNVFPDTIAQFN